MSSNPNIDQIIAVLAHDLNIQRFENESSFEYECRLVYSALSRWLLSLYSDRDYEDDNLEEISKAHVTICAENIINSYLMLDDSLKLYFDNPLKLVKQIEYEHTLLGYIESETYSFVRQDKSAFVAIANKCLIIDSESPIKKTRGIAIWGVAKPEDTIDFESFLLIKDNAEEYAEKMISILAFSPMRDSGNKIEIYDFINRRWANYSPNIIKKYKYNFAKIDDGLDYSIIKNVDDSFYYARVPSIYSKGNEDSLFEHETWRIILGLAKLNGFPTQCKISNLCKDAIVIEFNGYILPAFEKSLLDSMVWPLNNSLNINKYITESSMRESVNLLLKHLSIDILEG